MVSSHSHEYQRLWQERPDQYWNDIAFTKIDWYVENEMKIVSDSDVLQRKWTRPMFGVPMNSFSQNANCLRQFDEDTPHTSTYVQVHNHFFSISICSFFLRIYICQTRVTRNTWIHKLEIVGTNKLRLRIQIHSQNHTRTYIHRNASFVSIESEMKITAYNLGLNVKENTDSNCWLLLIQISSTIFSSSSFSFACFVFFFSFSVYFAFRLFCDRFMCAVRRAFLVVVGFVRWLYIYVGENVAPGTWPNNNNTNSLHTWKSERKSEKLLCCLRGRCMW